MMETLVIIAVVLAACAFLGRGIYRTMTGKASTCGCGEKTCPMQKDCASRDCSCPEPPASLMHGKTKS